MRIAIIILIFLFYSCHNKDAAGIAKQTQQSLKNISSVLISSTDSSLHFINGSWYYRDSLFSGSIETRYSNGQLKSLQTFFSGKEEGWSYSFYPNGKKESQRFYVLGEKDSIHLGWWNNGNRRFEYHFNKGNYDGDYKEWYVSGKPLKYIVYKNGEEVYGKGWRENGKLFMNYVMKDKRRYGLMNSQLCYSLKNEKGEFVRSTSDTLRIN